MNEANAEYDTDTIAKMSALHRVPRECRMTFDDTHTKYTRLEAMRVAKEQAKFREKAADYTVEGKRVPDDLAGKYNRTLRQKLNLKREDPPRQRKAATPMGEHGRVPSAGAAPRARGPRA